MLLLFGRQLQPVELAVGDLALQGSNHVAGCVFYIFFPIKSSNRLVHYSSNMHFLCDILVTVRSQHSSRTKMCRKNKFSGWVK